MHKQRSSLHEVGMAVIHAIGDEGFDSLSSALDSLDPDFKRLLVEGAYAGLIARPNLSLKHRELLTVAVLTTMGNADSALKYHAGGMLNTGWAPGELLETILQTLVYAGVPTAMAGVQLALQLFAERGITIPDEEPVSARRESNVTRSRQAEHEQLDSLPEEMQDIFSQVVYGTALNRPILTPKDRALATLGIVMVRQNELSTVRLHLKACVGLGWTRSELTEVLIQLTGYIGWPLVLPVTRVALEVFADMQREGSSSTPPLSEPIEPQVVPQSRARGLSAFSVPECIADMSPLVAHYLDDLGAAPTRPESDERAKSRCLMDIVCLTCLSRNADARLLSAHVKEALSLGASPRDIADAMMMALPHAGMLAVQSGLLVANRVIESNLCNTNDTGEKR